MGKQFRCVGRFEGLEHRRLLAADLATSFGGETTGDWFVADSFSFGVEREMKESGEKGGTEDINIGVGELQECTISKSTDRAASTPEGSFGATDAAFADYRFVKSWSTSSDADDRPTEEVSFYYNHYGGVYS